MFSLRLLAATSGLLLTSAVPALSAVDVIPNSALTPSTGYYTDSIGGGIGSIVVMTGGGSAPGIGDPTGRNDDGFSGPIPLGFTLSFFGGSYTTFFANNNGNISFTTGISAFTPTGPQGSTVPIISPYFADVDTRGAGSGVMHLRTDIADQIIVTWDEVGYFGAHDDKLASFQLVLRGPDYDVPVGEGNIGFFWREMGWEVGDASGGSGGFCVPPGASGCVPAAVGFGDGDENGVVLEASLSDGVSGVVRNHHIWFDPNLDPIPRVDVPEPSSIALLGIGVMGLVALRRRRIA
jgi:hypothetical protein